MLYLLLACTGAPADSTDTAPVGDGEYHVQWSTDPAPPEAGDHAEITATVIGPNGAPVEQLTLFEGAFLHTFIVPRDLSEFVHVHQEDETDVTTDELKSATFTYHAEFEVSGDYLIDFDFAAEGRYRYEVGQITAVGTPAQAASPTEDDTLVRVVDDVTVEIVWDVAPIAQQEAQWHLHLTSGDPAVEVTDVVQWGGADAHVGIVDWSASAFYHTHAWYPDMENAAPGDAMPPLYPGPDLPFHYTFPAAGRYRAWTQFARAGAPDEEYTVAFDIVVGE